MGGGGRGVKGLGAGGAVEGGRGVMGLCTNTGSLAVSGGVRGNGGSWGGAGGIGWTGRRQRAWG